MEAWDVDAVCAAASWAVVSAAYTLLRVAWELGLVDSESRVGGWEAAAVLLEEAGVDAPVYRARAGDCGAVLAVNLGLGAAASRLGL